MPIFMDRHDLPDTITAEYIAQLHQEDLKIEDQFGCRGLTYWFDSERKTAFCLVEAAEKGAIVKMHNHAHGAIPHMIIEVEPSIVESFLGRIEDPEKAKNTALNIINDPAFRTLMVLQLKSLSPNQNDPALRVSYRDHLNVVSDLLAKFEGNVVKQNEGALLVSFKSVTNAVQASFEISSSIKKANTNKISFKIGLSAGVPVTEEQSIFEPTIKAAERMCLLVNGEIIISTEVKDLFNSENSNTLKGGKNIRCITPSDEKFLNELIDYTELNWNNTSVKIDDLGKALGYSRSQLYRNMISLSGQSPNDFFKEYRLNEAFKLLDKDTKNISEVALETGFSNVSYFSKCFQKKYGYLPSQHFRSSKNP
ncbi:MAG TPA: nickel-binding protein [Chryseolinea sp.]|nr:nickel-binding protein [Chryseolinea sp.]